MERTFVMIKPDGVQRGLVGTIIHRLERKGLKLVALKLMRISPQLAETHYGVHRDRPFFPGLIRFITSGPVVAMVWEGRQAVKVVRRLTGATDPAEAESGSIRGDLAVDVGFNVIHASDGPETAAREVGLFFAAEELLDWQRQNDQWVYEQS